jgi:hypothetical protein
LNLYKKIAYGAVIVTLLASAVAAIAFAVLTVIAIFQVTWF